MDIKKAICVFGTRPEAIKMAPLIQQLRKNECIQSKICVTGQHKQMLESVLELFEIVPDFNFEVMTPNQNLSTLTAKILTGLAEVYTTWMPDFILVHGDTTTTLAASLSAYYHKIPVFHVEAGLRTGNIYSPWPEEINRKLTASLASIHFAPTPLSRMNLLEEGVNPEGIFVTGNTVIDALFHISNRIDSNQMIRNELEKQFDFLDSERKVILVTGHRRENFGEGFSRICESLAQIAGLYPDVDIVYPVHLNPNVQIPVHQLLAGFKNIHLISPIDYVSFIYLMRKSYFILTDSGGVQEEAPSLGKPVLVMRNNTERPEAVNAGTIELVGTDAKKIVAHASRLLTNHNHYRKMSLAQNPYGDGKASERIVEIILQRYSLGLKKEVTTC